MRLGIDFTEADEPLKRLGEAVQGFIRLVSESDPEDVATLLGAMDLWKPPDHLESEDLATLMGTIEALRLRLQHGPRGERPRQELRELDVTGLRPN